MGSFQLFLYQKILNKVAIFTNGTLKKQIATSRNACDFFGAHTAMNSFLQRKRKKPVF